MLKKIALFGLVTLNTILLSLPAPIVQAQEFNGFTCTLVSGNGIKKTKAVISGIRRSVYYVDLGSHESNCKMKNKNKSNQLTISIQLPANSKIKLAQFYLLFNGRIAAIIENGGEISWPLLNENFTIKAKGYGGSGRLYFLKYEAK